MRRRPVCPTLAHLPPPVCFWLLQEVLGQVPHDVDTLVFPNYESLPEREDVVDPFLEVSLFKKNYAHVVSGARRGGRRWGAPARLAACWYGPATPVRFAARLSKPLPAPFPSTLALLSQRARKPSFSHPPTHCISPTSPSPRPPWQTCTSSLTALWHAATPTTSSPTATANLVGGAVVAARCAVVVLAAAAVAAE